MLTLALAGVLWVVVAAHVLRGWRAMPRLDVVLAALATAMTVKAVMALSLVGGVAPRTVTFAAAAVAGVVAVELLRGLVAEGGHTSLAVTWALRAAALAYVTAATTLSLVGAAAGEAGRAVGGEQVVYNSPAVMTALYCLSGACLAGVTAWMVVLLLRLVDISPRGPIRQALALTAAGVAALVGYELLWLAQGFLGPMDLTAPWASAGIVVFKAASVLIAWAYLRATFFRSRLLGRWSDRKALAALEPLWRQLQPLDPAVTLLGYPSDPHALRDTNLELALWRTMVEIREWLDVVATRVPPGTYQAMAAAADRRFGAARGAGLAGQAWIQLGLAGLPGPDQQPDQRPPVGRDLDEELTLLLALAPRPDETLAVRDLQTAAVAADIPHLTRREAGNPIS